MTGINTDGFNPNHSKVLYDTSRTVTGAPSNEINNDSKESTSVISRIPDLSLLKKISQDSSPDIRPEALNRAQSLINNPDFLSDTKIDSLVSKLIDLDEI
jgi:hypothetical protein